MLQSQSPSPVLVQGQSQVVLQGQGQVITGQLAQQPLPQVVVGKFVFKEYLEMWKGEKESFCLFFEDSERQYKTFPCQTGSNYGRKVDSQFFE